MIKIDGIEIKRKDEKNLLELIRTAGIELPTFCYQPHLSVFGSCRMCIVEVEGRGIVPACSTAVTDNMVVTTTSKKLLDTRKMLVELLLAAHDQDCKTCPKSTHCKLQTFSKELGVTKIRFAQGERANTYDDSSIGIVRDTGKCILCGNCTRMCNETQKVGALNFAFRGSNAKVLTEFNRDMIKTDCVACGQCVKVCPVGALVTRSAIDDVINVLADTTKKVVVQVAPAVRVTLGECFGLDAGTSVTGKMISALRRMGFDKVFDTCWSADLTVIEETNEFIGRIQNKGLLPLFTNCCPAWVKYVENFYPEFLPNLSTCRSPQQMLGSVIKKEMGKDVVVVSVMPCTAKKVEAIRHEFGGAGVSADVNYVLTTGELAQMIKMGGINFGKLPEGEFDQPFGKSTGAAIIFGASGGVAEAVVRFAEKKLGKEKVAGLKVKAVSGLGEAKNLLDDIKAGKVKYDIIEVMACPGGCVNGGGQPNGCTTCSAVPSEAVYGFGAKCVEARKAGIRSADKKNPLHVSDENKDLPKYDEKTAHDLLHTKYKAQSRKKK